jgi:hypothetical protein
MLIGPPESGKTELLKPLLGIDGCVECGDISGKGALLSGTPASQRTQDSTGGLLNTIDKQRGVLVMLDFARTVLASDMREMRSTLGAIGMLHDQHYKRSIGADGGRSITFDGKLGWIAASTDAIDHPDNHQANSEMGDRCLYYRYPVSTGYHEISSALDNPDSSYKTQKIQGLFKTWQEEIGLDWEHLAPPRTLEEDEKRRVSALAQFCARARSAVYRDRWRQEVAGISRAALGPRIANSLAQLLRGMEHIGCTQEEIWKVLCHTAIDSIPAVRAHILKLLQEDRQTLQEVADKIQIALPAAKRTIEDLRIHDLVAPTRPNGQSDGQSDGQTGGQTWTLSEKGKGLLDFGWQGSKIET